MANNVRPEDKIGIGSGKTMIKKTTEILKPGFDERQYPSSEKFL